MSTPMEISEQQNIVDVNTSDQIGVVFETPPSALPSPVPAAIPEDKFLVSVEVCLKSSSTARIEDVQSAVEKMLEKRSLSYIDGPIVIPHDDQFLVDNVQRICVCDTDVWVENHDILLFWQVKPVVHVFQLGLRVWPQAEVIEICS